MHATICFRASTCAKILIFSFNLTQPAVAHELISVPTLNPPIVLQGSPPIRGKGFKPYYTSLPHEREFIHADIVRPIYGIVPEYSMSEFLPQSSSSNHIHLGRTDSPNNQFITHMPIYYINTPADPLLYQFISEK